MFNTNNKGFGFGAMPGFNRRKVGSISNGDFDRDGVKNRKDCDAFNFRKQGPKHEVIKKVKFRRLPGATDEEIEQGEGVGATCPFCKEETVVGGGHFETCEHQTGGDRKSVV